MRDGEPTVYACEDRACSPPAHSVEEALSWFEGGPDVDLDSDVDLEDVDADFD
jgi:hypothetical protein